MSTMIEGIQTFPHKVAAWRSGFMALDSANKCYAIFVGLVVCYFPSVLTISIFAHTAPVGFLMLYSSLILASIASGYCIEGFNWVQKKWTRPVGKFIVSGLTAVISALCLFYARHELNALTHVDPDPFDMATAIFTIIYLPLVILALVGTLVMGSSIIASLYAYRSGKLELGRKLPPNKLVWCRLFGGPALAFVLMIPSGFVDQYRDGFDQLKRWSLAITSYYANSDCDNVTENQRVAFLGDNRISIASHNGKLWTFQTTKCEHQEADSNQK